MDDRDLPQASPESFEPRNEARDIILGEIDPSTLTEDEFYNSQDLLFHGTTDEDFKFDREFNYRTTDTPNSHTLGRGFYTSDKFEYAARHAAKHDGSGIIAIMPHNARMLDMRNQTRPETNMPLSQDFITRWIEFSDEFTKGLSQREGMRTSKAQYGNYNRLLQSMKGKIEGITLDQLLTLKFGTRQSKERYHQAILKMDPNANLADFTYEEFPRQFIAMRMLGEFMMRQGYDGLIQWERHDDMQSNAPSFVFYNLDKIGTYEDWHVAGDQEVEQVA